MKGENLRTVEIKIVQHIQEGDEIGLSLMKREKSKISVREVSNEVEVRSVNGFWDEKNDISKFSRIKVYFDPLPDLETQEIELKKLLDVADEESEISAIKRAQEILQSDINKLQNCKQIKSFIDCKCQTLYHPIYLYEIACPKHPKKSDYLPVLAQNLSAEESKENCEFLYFYQIKDTQPYYLHPLNERLLLQQFKSFDNFPVSLNGKILEIEQIPLSQTSPYS